MIPAVALALAATAAASAQEPGPWAMRRADVAVDVTSGDGHAEVTARYELVALDVGDAPPLDHPIPFELLDFGDVATAEIVLEGRGPLVLRPTVGSHRVTVVDPVPEPTAEGTVVLDIRYAVEDAVDVAEDGVGLRVRVPVLAGPTAVADAEEPVFRATVDVPDAWSVTEAFPSALRRADAVGHRYVVTLPVVPSVVGFRGRTDGAWRPGFPLLVDVLTVLILVAFAGFGWRYLRKAAA